MLSGSISPPRSVISWAMVLKVRVRAFRSVKKLSASLEDTARRKARSAWPKPTAMIVMPAAWQRCAALIACPCRIHTPSASTRAARLPSTPASRL